MDISDQKHNILVYWYVVAQLTAKIMILSKSVSQICGNYITSFCVTSRIKIIAFGSAAFISPIEPT